MDSFAEEFHQHFAIVQANTPELLGECQRLRYHVFCKEHHIFCANRYLNDQEYDCYDARSVHSLLRHRTSQLAVATVRLVLPDHNDPDPRYPLVDQLDKRENPLQSINTLSKQISLAEISRFSVSKEFRRRSNERRYAHNLVHDLNTAQSERGIRHHPYITLGLFKAIVQMSQQYQVDHWCAAMEPTLIRLLGRFGIRFSPLGPLVDYFGLRQPCYAAVSAVLQGIQMKRPDVWEFITEAHEERSSCAL